MAERGSLNKYKTINANFAYMKLTETNSSQVLAFTALNARDITTSAIIWGSLSYPSKLSAFIVIAFCLRPKNSLWIGYIVRTNRLAKKYGLHIK